MAVETWSKFIRLLNFPLMGCPSIITRTYLESIPSILTTLPPSLEAATEIPALSSSSSAMSLAPDSCMSFREMTSVATGELVLILLFLVPVTTTCSSCKKVSVIQISKGSLDGTLTISNDSS